jgi:hypothetical protein
MDALYTNNKGVPAVVFRRRMQSRLQTCRQPCWHRTDFHLFFIFHLFFLFVLCLRLRLSWRARFPCLAVRSPSARPWSRNPPRAAVRLLDQKDNQHHQMQRRETCARAQGLADVDASAETGAGLKQKSESGGSGEIQQCAVRSWWNTATSWLDSSRGLSRRPWLRRARTQLLRTNGCRRY